MLLNLLLVLTNLQLSDHLLLIHRLSVDYCFTSLVLQKTFIVMHNRNLVVHRVPQEKKDFEGKCEEES